VDDLSKEEKFICLEKEKENVNIEKLKSGEFKVVHGSMEMESSFTTWFRLDAIPQNWKEALVEKESKKEYWKKLMRRLMAEDLNKSLVIYPNPQDRFSFMTLPLQNIKIVILGQDPYHGPNQAHGLSFSVQKGIKIPPSLVNIYKELQNDLGVETFGKDLPNHGYLKEWHDQGVLMLNATLTVQKTRPNSHAKYGWQNFTGLCFILYLILFTNLV
jgi:uracil-DNA glycosylase